MSGLRTSGTRHSRATLARSGVARRHHDAGRRHRVVRLRAPRPYLDAMERLRSAVWVNSSTWPRKPGSPTCMRCLAASPTRAATLVPVPGFSARSGGLLRERELFASRDAFNATDSRVRPWTSLGLPAPPHHALHVSLFCYANPRSTHCWKRGATMTSPSLPRGRTVLPARRSRGWSRRPPAPGRLRRIGSRRWRSHRSSTRAIRSPVMGERSQHRAREDSFRSRAMAARPFVWHIIRRPSGHTSQSSRRSSIVTRRTFRRSTERH